MHCTEIRNRLPAHAAGELAADESAKIETHLGACDGCRKEAAAYRKLEETVQGAAPLHIPDGLAQRVQSTLRGRRRPERARPRRTWLVPGFAGLAAVAILTFFLLPSGPGPAPARTLADYLLHRDYIRLHAALQENQARERLLGDSVSVDLLLRALRDARDLQRNYGQAGKSVARALASTGIGNQALSRSRGALGSAEFNRLIRGVARAGASHRQITLRMLVKASRQI